MYRVGGKGFLMQSSMIFSLFDYLDYVYFEGNPTEPFLIRRIEELNKVSLKKIEMKNMDELFVFRLHMEMLKHVWRVSIVVEIFHLI